MQTAYNTEVTYELGIDESGRGSIVSRVYAAAVVLPKPPSSFEHSWMRDSKKIKSKKKMAELAEYIKNNAVAYSIQYEEADVIDRVNILQANMMAMHKCITEVLQKLNSHDVHLLVDGNYFKPFTFLEETTESLETLPYTTIEQGDGKYHNIAAASILAKHARDSHILELCKEYPELQERYGLATNMGYGTAKHLRGINVYGITQWHRKSFAPCKNINLSTDVSGLEPLSSSIVN
jgi:ribonuclease HII